MSYNGSGTFLVNSSGQPVVSGTTITSTAFNALTADLATGLSTAITKDGQTTTTARVPFLFGISSTLTTDSTSTGTGSIITLGGVGIAKALWVGGLTNIAGALTGTTGVFTGALQSTTYFSSDGIILLSGSSATEVRLQRSTTTLKVRLGDDSADAGITASTGVFSGASQSTNYLTTDSIIYLGGNASSNVSLRRTSTTLNVRLGDDSANAGIVVGNLTATGTVNLGGASGTFANSVTAVNGVVTGGT